VNKTALSSFTGFVALLARGMANSSQQWKLAASVLDLHTVCTLVALLVVLITVKYAGSWPCAVCLQNTWHKPALMIMF